VHCGLLSSKGSFIANIFLITTITQTQQVQGTHTNTISTMTANINTILVLGATSGIGEAFTRYFHIKGKTVIAAGRRLERSMP
jgi:NADP-dependent 3-hydroxy acid dehydrogenase YdfG